MTVLILLRWFFYQIQTSMEGKLRCTVLQLKDGNYIHFSKIQSYNKFGYEALFTNNDTGNLAHVQFFSKSVLKLNAMTDHLLRAIQLYKPLKHRKIVSISEVIDQLEGYFVVSQGYSQLLSDLIEKRQGLTQFQVAYFLGELYQIFGYLRDREVYLQKVCPDNLFLTQELKLVVGFSIFLNCIGEKPVIRRLPFRNEIRNRNNCPDLFFKKEMKASALDEVNAWLMGIILYQVIENKEPFKCTNDDLIGKARGQTEEEISQLLNKEYSLQFSQTFNNQELMDLLRKLLKPNHKDRLKFSSTIIHPFLKMFPTLPHILPPTVFSCPPSEHYKQQFFKRFLKDTRNRTYETARIQHGYTVSLNQNQINSQKDFKGNQWHQKDRVIKTQIEIPSEVTLSQSFVMIEEYVDISDSFGYGYQMNTGIVGFVFNDETQFLCNGSCQEIRARNRGKNKQQMVYSHQKLPQQDQVRKKIHILEAFTKTLKRKRMSGSEKERTITVSQYCRTKYASMFLLTNDSIQVFFNDKVAFLLTKNQIHIQCKNSQHFERFDYNRHDEDMQLRRDYCVDIAHKVFMWDGLPEPNILDIDGLDIES